MGYEYSPSKNTPKAILSAALRGLQIQDMRARGRAAIGGCPEFAPKAILSAALRGLQIQDMRARGRAAIGESPEFAEFAEFVLEPSKCFPI